MGVTSQSKQPVLFTLGLPLFDAFDGSTAALQEARLCVCVIVVFMNSLSTPPWRAAENQFHIYLKFA